MSDTGALISNITWNNIDTDQNYQVCDADSTLEISTENSLVQDQNQRQPTGRLNMLSTSNEFPEWKKDLNILRHSTQATTSPFLPLDDQYPNYQVMFTRSQPFPRELQYENTHSSDAKQKEDKATLSRVTSNISPELRSQPVTTKEPRNYEELFHRSNCYHTAMINSPASTIPPHFQRNIFDCYSNGKTINDAVFSGNTTCEDFEPNFDTASFDSEKKLPGYETSDMSYRNENDKVYNFQRFLKTHRNTNPIRDCQSKFVNFDSQTQSCQSGPYLNNPKLSLPDCSRFMQMENEPNVTVFKNISQRPFNSHLPISIRSGPPDCTRTRQPIIRMEPEYSINADDEYEIEERTCVNVNIDKLHTGGLDKTPPLCSTPVHPSTTSPSLSTTAAAETTSSTPLTTASASSSDSKEIPQRDQMKPFRQPYLPFQLELLEASYNKERFCSGETRKKLVKRTGLSDKQIRIWYQNRRAKSKKKANTFRHNLPTRNCKTPPDWMSSKTSDHNVDDDNDNDDDDDDDDDSSSLVPVSLKRVQVYRPWFPFGIDPKQFCPVHRQETASRRSSHS
ncbi:uncharacterized protein LOC128250792 isoform X2 [Octopus bimaculoides]|nr:uncharacterized protein LOC128250792 isoform X2 [Octopus bimaculoides]